MAFSLCFHMGFLLCTGFCIQIFPFYKNISYIGSGPTLWPHFNLITSVSIIFPNRSCSKVLGIRILTKCSQVLAWLSAWYRTRRWGKWDLITDFWAGRGLRGPEPSSAELLGPSACKLRQPQSVLSTAAQGRELTWKWTSMPSLLTRTPTCLPAQEWVEISSWKSALM